MPTVKPFPFFYWAASSFPSSLQPAVVDLYRPASRATRIRGMSDDVCEECGLPLAYRSSSTGSGRGTSGCDKCGTTVGFWSGRERNSNGIVFEPLDDAPEPVREVGG